MNLKEAFQAQNKISALIGYIDGYLSDTDNLMTVTEKHLKSKALAGQSDESVDASQKSEENYDAHKMLAAWKTLTAERSALIAAISAAKCAMEFDFDATVDENKNRRSFIAVLHNMATLKSSHVLQKNKGMDYVFNNEGNQISYRYDIDQIKTIDYDRNEVRAMLKDLQKEADEVSLKIDAALLNTVVNYEAKIDLVEDNELILEELMK